MVAVPSLCSHRQLPDSCRACWSEAGARLVDDEWAGPEPTAEDAWSDDFRPVRDLAGDVDYELHRLAVRAKARELFDARRRSKSAARQPLELVSLPQLLAEPDEGPRFRVDGLMPAQGRVLLAASFKSGKSTLVGNLTRSLVDGAAFLDAFEVQRVARQVVIVDTELDRGTLRRWLADQCIENAGQVTVVPLRGRVGQLDILDDHGREQWAQRLSDLGAEVLILDPVAPVLSSLGLDEDRAPDVGRFAAAFDELLDLAGISEAVVVHHTGHAGERSRGSSRLLDWPDASWRLVLDGDEETPPQDRRRYFTAVGRDVDVPEQLLGFDRATRRLTVAGGSRRDTAADVLVAEVVSIVMNRPGATQNQLEAALASQASKNTIRRAARRAVELGELRIEEGPRGARQHYIR